MRKMASSEDSQIIRRCLDGEAGVFEAIVRKYQAGVLLVAWSVLGNREDAMDASQETFLRAFSNLGSFDHAREFKNWLHAIAYHACLDQVKKKKTEKRFRFEAVALTSQRPGEPERDPGIEESEIVRPFWMRLTVKERLALSLALNEGYSAVEIAKVLECSENCARVHVCHAKSKLKKWLIRSRHVQDP
jgi:RNA polymerase sigma-70 factor (ECF subfamily)